MKQLLHPAVPIGVRKPFVSPEDSLVARIQTVLETRPGRLPWRPDFGCDLNPLVGQPATPQRLNEARWRVEEAIRHWVPDANIDGCVVRVVGFEDGSGRIMRRDVPLAEASLMSLGVQAGLEVVVDVLTPTGPLTLQAIIEP